MFYVFFDVDATTLGGTSRLVDLMMEDLNITPEDLNNRHVDMVGDQLSNARVRSLHQLRLRDYSEHRMALGSSQETSMFVSLSLMQTSGATGDVRTAEILARCSDS